MPRGSAPGERRGGRQKGVPNKITTETRNVLAKLFEDNVQAFTLALQELAGSDVEAFVTAYLKLAEFAVPKLNRLSIDLTKLSLEQLAQELARREAEAKADGE